MDVFLIFLMIVKLLSLLVLGYFLFCAVKCFRPFASEILPAEFVGKMKLFKVSPKVYLVLCVMCFLAVVL